MQSGLFAKKVGMTQIFDESGNIIPVTILKIIQIYIRIFILLVNYYRSFQTQKLIIYTHKSAITIK